MAEFISVEAVKNILTECPICTEQFDEDSHVPGRMPCCVQSIFQPCLETYSRGRQTLSCPMCRHQHHLPGGVKSLSKEPLILKILDHLKMQKGIHLPCTGCPDNQGGVAQCDNCGIFLCTQCHNAHKRNMATKNHKIVNFEEMKDRPVESFRRLHQCMKHEHPLKFFCMTCDKVICVSCTVVEHKEGKGHLVISLDEAHQDKGKSSEEMLDKLDQKADKLSQITEELKKKKKNIKTSRQTAKCEIIKDSLNTMLEESPQDVEFDRAGVVFVPAYVQNLISVVNGLGLVRTVTYSPNEKPASIPKDALYNSVTLEPEEFPQVPDLDSKIKENNGVIICQHLEWDTQTASNNVTVTESMVTNTTPEPTPPDTECRIQAGNRVLASRPLVVSRGERIMYQMKVKINLKQTRTNTEMIIESALVTPPMDFDYNQSGLSVCISRSSTNIQQLALEVRYNDKVLSKVPIMMNTVGVPHNLHLSFLLDGAGNKIHVLDVDDFKMVCAVTDVVLDKPLWVFTYLGLATRSVITSELISGNKITASQEMNQLLSSLQ